MEIPSYVPESAKSQWQNIFASNLVNGPEYAKLSANVWLQQNSAIVNPQPQAEERLELLSFTIDNTELVLQTLDQGQEYVLSAVLADNAMTRTGHTFSEELLKKFADQINARLPVGDMDHEEMIRLEKQGYSGAEIASMLKSRQKNGIVKAIQAVYEKGKLWVKLLIDKRYKKIMNKAKGLSIEALATVQTGDKVVKDAEFLGFTVAYNHSPANPRALLAMTE